MTSSETAQKLAAMMTDLLQTPVDPENPEALIIDDYGADSMDFMELADKVEMLFKIEITNSDASGLIRFGDILNLIDNKMTND